LQRVKCFPKYLVDLYQKSLKDIGKGKIAYEIHFNVESNETTTSGKIHQKVGMPNLMVAAYMDMENTIVKYNLNDVFGILTRLSLCNTLNFEFLKFAKIMPSSKIC
jgi:hypothetical protein